MKTYHTLLGLLFIGHFALAGCKKEEDTPLDVPIELNCDDFKSAMNLVDDPNRTVDYYVPCVMEVDADISVGPGVVIEFAADAGIQVNDGGSFRASGTASAPIQMTGKNKATGSWKGLYFDSNNTNNRLNYVNISYAGSSAFNSNNDIAAVVIWSDTKLDMQNVTISNSGGYGISSIYTNTDWSISNSRITACTEAPAIFLGPYLTAFDGSNDFTGNAKDHLIIDIATQEIENSLTWRKTSVPYRVRSTYSLFNNLTIDNATVTIEPGTNIEFESGTGLWIDDNGALVARGTTSEYITFSGIVQTAGSWNAIYFDATGTTNNEISYANIRHAGAILDGNNSGILMRVNPTLKLDFVNFSDIDGCSVYNKDVMLNPNLSSSNLTHNNTLGTLCSD